MAAPIGAQLFGEILPYLQIKKDAEDIEEIGEVEVPLLEGKSLKEASEILKQQNLEIVINNEQEVTDKSTTIIKEQTPKAGVKVKEQSNIYVNF